MPMKILMSRTMSNNLVCAFNTDLESLKKIPLNETVEVEIKRPRNLKLHRKYFALINLVFDNQEQYKHQDELRRDLTIEAGYYETYYDFHGVEKKKPKSISFASMSEDEFNKLYNATIDVICTYFHFGKDELIQEVAQYF